MFDQFETKDVFWPKIYSNKFSAVSLQPLPGWRWPKKGQFDTSAVFSSHGVDWKPRDRQINLLLEYVLR